MPVLISRIAGVRALTAVCASLALTLSLTHSATAQVSEPNKVENSDLDAPLFYQLLIGEMELRLGDPGTAFQVMLDAARRSKDEQLFRRATDIALEARAGDQALVAVKAWRDAVPGSLEAHRYQVQLLVALNRVPDTLEPLRSLIEKTPVADRAILINSLPRLFARSTDRAAAANVLVQALQPYADAPPTAVAATVAMGRGWLAAGDSSKAFDLVQRAHTLDPASESPALLALEMLPTTPAVEPIIVEHLKAKPGSNGVRLLYVRSLTGSQRYAEAAAQLDTVTKIEPTLAPPWLTLGALQLEMRRPAEATAALQTYVQLVQAGATVAPKPGDATDGDDADAPVSDDQALTQAWLLLSQAAEQSGDFAGAESWLAKVGDPQRAIEVQTRRASMLARQGKIAEARELIRHAPEKDANDARTKLMAEAQILREAKRWADANAVLAQANQKFPNDVDLLYEQSMVAEKLNRMDEMERLLRRVIELKPDHQHAYNALGYSLAERNMRLPEARSLIRKALDLSPGEPFITDSLGWVEYRLGNRDEALRLLRDAFQSRPDPEIAAHLGEVLWVTGKPDEARQVWREGRGRDSANDVLRETLARLRVDL